MMLKAFVTQAIQTSEIGIASHPSRIWPPKKAIVSGRTIPPETAIVAPRKWTSSFVSARTERMSSMNETMKTGISPPAIAAKSSGDGICVRDGFKREIAANTANAAVTTARPPSRGIGSL